MDGSQVLGTAVAMSRFLGLEIPEPSAWNPWIWTLHGLAAIYTLLFFVAWVKFRAAWKRVEAGESGAVAAFNRAIQGFPWSFYAKMLGQHSYRPSEEEISK